MSATLLQLLDEAGVTLWWDGEALRYRAPCEALTPSLRQAMREGRGALIVAVQARGGVLLPRDRGCWPEALANAYERCLQEIVSGGRISGPEAERRAASRAAIDWLRAQVGDGGSGG